MSKNRTEIRRQLKLENRYRGLTPRPVTSSLVLDIHDVLEQLADDYDAWCSVEFTPEDPGELDVPDADVEGSIIISLRLPARAEVYVRIRDTFADRKNQNELLALLERRAPGQRGGEATRRAGP